MGLRNAFNKSKTFVTKPPAPVLFLLLCCNSGSEYAEFNSTAGTVNTHGRVRVKPSILSRGWACITCKASPPLPAVLSSDGENNSAPDNQDKKRKVLLLF